MKYSKLPKTVAAGMITSALIFSGIGSVFADGETNVEVKAVEELETEQPSLVPGEFFYFTKIMIEKVRLAITFDEYKEARLLAEFAEERIAEANVLLEEGKKEEAEELLKQAIATQETAVENIIETEEVEEEVGEVQTEVSESSEENEVSAENEEQVIEEETIQEEEPEEIEKEVHSKLAHNIDALTAALAKIENPRAQEALMKNIEKTFAKLDKKIAKLEKKAEKRAEKKNEVEAIDDTQIETEIEENIIVEQEQNDEVSSTKESENTNVISKVVPSVEKNKEKLVKNEKKHEQSVIKNQKETKQVQTKNNKNKGNNNVSKKGNSNGSNKGNNNGNGKGNNK